MNEVTWGIPVAFYLFFAGLGSGSFCLGAIAAKRAGQGWKACSRMAFLISPLAILAGLLMLVLDLRYSTRFWRTLTVLNLESPMSVGVWLLSAFFLVSILSAFPRLPESLRGKSPGTGQRRKWQKWGRKLEMAGIPLALGVSVYTGVLLSATIIPIWRNLSLPVLLCLSALSLGIESGAVLGMASLRKRNLEAMKEPLQFLRRSYRVILPLYLFAALLFVVFVVVSPASRRTAFHLMTGWSGLIWWIGVVGMGILLPLVFVMRKANEQISYAWIFSGCLLFGDFLLRLFLVLAGQGKM